MPKNSFKYEIKPIQAKHRHTFHTNFMKLYLNIILYFVCTYGLCLSIFNQFEIINFYYFQWKCACALSKSQSVIKRTNSNSTRYYSITYIGEIDFDQSVPDGLTPSSGGTEREYSPVRIYINSWFEHGFRKQITCFLIRRKL